MLRSLRLSRAGVPDAVFLRLRIDVPEHLDRRVVELERLQLTVKELTTLPGKTTLEDLA